MLERLGLEPGGYCSSTVHREANVQPERLRRIVEGLDRVEGPLVFPAHPRTRNALAELAAEARGRSASRRSPRSGYLDFAALASQARVILTDSGGLQKEAYWYGVPCVTLRPSTEWVDTVEAGGERARRRRPRRDRQAAADARFPAAAPQLYGDGHAGERVAAALYASAREP